MVSYEITEQSIVLNLFVFKMEPREIHLNLDSHIFPIMVTFMTFTIKSNNAVLSYLSSKDKVCKQTK